MRVREGSGGENHNGKSHQEIKPSRMSASGQTKNPLGGSRS